MTWEAKDLRKNVDPVPEELLVEKGAFEKDVGEKTPYNELLDAGWEQYFATDAPLSNDRIPQHMKRAYNDIGLITEEQWATKRRMMMRGIIPDSGLDDPSLYG